MKAKGAAQPTCGTCGFAVPAAVDRCVKCGADVGYPNVRAASAGQEVTSLDARVERAFVSAGASGCTTNLLSFQSYASRSQAVIVRSIAQLDTFVHADNVMLATYHASVQASSRLPEDNEWDPRRVSIDAAINAGFHEKIHYAALSGDGLGGDQLRRLPRPAA